MTTHAELLRRVIEGGSELRVPRGEVYVREGKLRISTLEAGGYRTVVGRHGGEIAVVSGPNDTRFLEESAVRSEPAAESSEEAARGGCR